VFVYSSSFHKLSTPLVGAYYHDYESEHVVLACMWVDQWNGVGLTTYTRAYPVQHVVGKTSVDISSKNILIYFILCV
jgi:hypothetical protein